jgi:ribonuclease VapC
MLSAVNLSEVLATIGSVNRPFDDLFEYLMSGLFGGMLHVVPFDEAFALAAARLRPLTRASGLSLGDRACLALAQVVRGTALTADRRWAEVADTVGVTVRVIRP